MYEKRLKRGAIAPLFLGGGQTSAMVWLNDKFCFFRCFLNACFVLDVFRGVDIPFLKSIFLKLYEYCNLNGSERIPECAQIIGM